MADQGAGLRVVLVMVAFLATSIFQTQGIIDFRGTNMEPPTANQTQFPWQVLVEITAPALTGLCGASIIKKQWIMSAAHCFVESKYDKEKNPDGFVIFATKIVLYAGIINKNDKTGRNVQKREYNKDEIRATGTNQVVFIHEQYNQEKNGSNDIALFKLKDPLVLSDYVGEIELATNDDYKVLKDLTASGWGSVTLTDPLLMPDELRYVQGLRLLERDSCLANIKTFIDKGICIITQGKATYSGDSGGPVITGNGDSNGPPYVQIGIVSAVQDRTDFFGFLLSVFTDVAKFEDWITKITHNKANPPTNCRTPRQTPGNCIALPLCKVIFDQMQNPSPQFITHLRSSVCAYEGKTPLICCPIEEE